MSPWRKARPRAKGSVPLALLVSVKFPGVPPGTASLTVTDSGRPARVRLGLMVKSTVRPLPAAPQVSVASTYVLPAVIVLVAEPVPLLLRVQVIV